MPRSSPTEINRRRLEPNDRLNCALRCYVTRGEQTAVDLLATDVYQGRSDVIRQAIAFLIQTKHPDLNKFLRSDLDPLTKG
jgi:hypothetical protein